MIKACKFGGTSMADGTNFLRVKEIVEGDEARRYIVVSAPGKRYSGDSKVTDLLLSAHEELLKTGRLGASFGRVRERFLHIVLETGLKIDFGRILDETAQEIEAERSEAFTASRGEYLAGRIMAELLGVPFLDAREVIRFCGDRFDGETTYPILREALKGKKRAVVAGYYGADETGRVRTFSRGGSDVTGAIVARAAGAGLYENWTDVSGFLACDPHIVPSPARIEALSYKELRELSYMGANVMHSESIFPVREAGIPIRICNTFRPEDGGTYILPKPQESEEGRPVTGIAGKKNFTVIFLEKSLMNAEIGFAYRALEVLMRHGISFEHMPSGIDTMSFVIDSEQLKGGALEQIEAEIGAAVRPDRITSFDNIALLAVVGHGIHGNVGTSARLFRAIARAGVNVRMIDQGSSELNIIVGVDNEDYERTVRAVYEEFFK